MNPNQQNAVAIPASQSEGFGNMVASSASEAAASAVAAQARAAVESRYIMAMRRPRNWDQVRQDILKECHRPSFAHNKSALYRKPIGDGIEGLGIRFAEVAMRCMTNVLIEPSAIFEDATKEIIRVTVTDLESNTTYAMDVRVSKTVERSRPMDDGSFISVRKNSYGKAVYTVPANDDDLLNKRNAQISKAMRALCLRIIPGDIQDEAEAIIRQIRMDDAARDPDAERKRMIDAFSEIGVKAVDLTDYLGHDIGACSPKELVDLRGIYGAIRDGEATWASVIENVAELRGKGAEQKKAPAAQMPPAEGKAASAKEKAKAKAQQAEQSAGSEQQGNSGAPEVTKEIVAAKLKGAADAGDVDLLDAASELIILLQNQEEQKELYVGYRTLRQKLLEGEA